MDRQAQGIAISLEPKKLEFQGVENHVIIYHLIPLVIKLCGKELTFPYPWHKDMVAFP